MEFLVRVVSKSPANPDDTWRTGLAGDVVAIRPDFTAWGKGEREAPYWTILRADIPRIESALLMADEIDPELAKTNRYLRRRLGRLDLRNLPPARRAILSAQRTASGDQADGATYTARAVETIPVTATEFRALVIDVARHPLDPRGA